MQRSRQANGFTLIEVMITIAIVAILAAVAVMSYTQYIQRAYNAEAHAILADIRLKQEAYRATFHQYAFQGDPSGWYPNDSPGRAARAWGSDVGWNQLGIRPSDPVRFSYYTESGTPGADVAGDMFPDLSEVTTNGNDFWYAAQAIQDYNGNGACGGFEIYTGNAAIVQLVDDDGKTDSTSLCP